MKHITIATPYLHDRDVWDHPVLPAIQIDSELIGVKTSGGNVKLETGRDRMRVRRDQTGIESNDTSCVIAAIGLQRDL